MLVYGSSEVCGEAVPQTKGSDVGKERFSMVIPEEGVCFLSVGICLHSCEGSSWQSICEMTPWGATVAPCFLFLHSCLNVTTGGFIK